MNGATTTCRKFELHCSPGTGQVFGHTPKGWHTGAWKRRFVLMDKALKSLINLYNLIALFLLTTAANLMLFDTLITLVLLLFCLKSVNVVTLTSS